MANLKVKDGDAANKYLKASGAGTDGDPHIPEHKETSAAAILAALGGTLTINGAVTGPVTDAQLRATPLPVSGTVTTGGLTDMQLRATPVPISGSVSTGGLTDAQLRNSAVPVSGPLTNTELRATAVPVSGTVTANPTARTLSVVASTAASSGDNTIIAAPGTGQRIVLVSVQLQLEASTATVALLKDSTTNVLRLRMVNDGDGIVHQWPMDARYRMTANTALVLNLSGANSTGYTVFYYTEAA